MLEVEFSYTIEQCTKSMQMLNNHTKKLPALVAKKSTKYLFVRLKLVNRF